jgi:hypothetical protein
MATKNSKNGKVQEKEQTFTRDDFFRDLKKVAKKQDRPSPRGQEKR